MVRKLGLLAFLLFVCIAGLVSAQREQVITYGTAEEGEISTASPLATYRFNGTRGDLVTVRVISLSPGFDPRVRMLAPDDQPIAANDNDPFDPGSTDARLSFRLSQAGAYSLLVSGTDGTTGSYLLRIDALRPDISIPLTLDTTARAEVSATTPPQVYVFNTVQTSATTLTINSEPATFPFTAEVRDASGTLIAVFSGLMDGGAISFAPGDSLYEVTVSSPDAGEVSGAVLLSLLATAPRPEPTIAAVSGTGCTVSPTSGSVNVRSGPGTNYDVISSFIPGSTLNVIGTSADGSWYAVSLNGQQAWVAASVTFLSAACNALATLEAPPTPTPTITFTPSPTSSPTPSPTMTFTASPTFTPSLTPSPTQTFTATLTPSITPTFTSTFTPAPSATPTLAMTMAANDRDYSLPLTRLEDARFSEEISAPEGDVDDLINVSVSNLDEANPQGQYSFTLICSGSGAERLRWQIDDNPDQVCGATVNVAFDLERTERIIQLRLPDEAPPAYVFYTLIVTWIG
jgi:hypothetical protein